MDIQKIPTEQLKAATYNPRKDLKPGDAEYEKLRRSIEEFGYVEPVIWNKRTGNIIGGHQRYKILTEQGTKEIECVVVDMDMQKEKALNIALNKVSGEWDTPLLEDLLKDLSDSGFDVTLTGFDLNELVVDDNLISEDVKEDDFDADKALSDIKTPMSRRGDVWLLGKHRLMCGDSTSQDDVGVLMNGKKARHVFTDPPWNVDYGSSTNHPSWKSRSIMNDSMPTDQFKEFMERTFSAMKAVCEPGCMTYVVMSAQEWGSLMNVLTEAGYHWSSTVIWKKDSLVLSRKDYHTQYEPIWYGWLEGSARLVPLKDRKQTDVWDIPRPKRSEEHPTMKPIALVAKSILNSSHKGDLVLDLFGGSGTTLLASEQTERVCHIMELDEKYADVIVKRYIESAGSDAGVFLLRGEEQLAHQDIKKGELL